MKTDDLIVLPRSATEGQVITALEGGGCADTL